MRVTRLRAELGTNPRLLAGLVVGLLVAVGVLFSVFNVSLVQAATAAIEAPQLDAPVPETDPFSPLWTAARPADIPLSAQQIYQPGGGGSVSSVQVRALHDGKRIAFLVSWADKTRNDYVKDTPSDAAAIELPIDPQHLPYQCMGQTDSRVNIWQWKAAIERVARESAQPYNGARNLTSNGLGKAVETSGVPPTATSTWKDGRWYVIYSRDLAPADSGTAPLAPGAPTNAAFAVWDGGSGETRSMKAVTTWVPLTIDEAASNSASSLITMVIAGLVGAGIVVLAWRLIPH